MSVIRTAYDRTTEDRPQRGVATIHPAAADPCNGVDDNCDGTIDNSGVIVTRTYYADRDGDGYGAGTAAVMMLDQGATTPAGYATTSTDRYDRDPYVRPGADHALQCRIRTLCRSDAAAVHGQRRTASLPDLGSTITVLDLTVHHVSPDAREEAAVLAREFDSTTLGIAHVMEGSGFGAAARRMILSGILAMSGGRADAKVFESTLDAANWMVDRIGETKDRSRTVAAIAAHVEAARRASR